MLSDYLIYPTHVEIIFLDANQLFLSVCIFFSRTISSWITPLYNIPWFLWCSRKVYLLNSTKTIWPAVWHNTCLWQVTNVITRITYSHECSLLKSCRQNWLALPLYVFFYFTYFVVMLNIEFDHQNERWIHYIALFCIYSQNNWIDCRGQAQFCNTLFY